VTLPPILLLLIGLPMFVVGWWFVVRFVRHNRLDRNPPEPAPQDAAGPVWAQNALLGALLVAVGGLMIFFAIAALVAGAVT
jgi:hypothetical protein